MAANESRLRLLAGRALPPGWCGKNFACAQLAAAATAPILIFVDADVQLAPNSAPRLAAFLEQSGAQLASGIPHEVTITFSEQLLIPLIHFLLLGFLPFRRMRRLRQPAYAAGCGQLFVAEAAAYRAAGGHGVIRDRIHDGLCVTRKNFVNAVLRLISSTRLSWPPVGCINVMVRSRRGLGKNTHEGLGAPRLIFPMTVILLGGQVLPFLLALAPVAPLVRAMALLASGLSFCRARSRSGVFDNPGSE